MPDSYIPKNITASTTIKPAHGIVRAIYCIKAGAAGSKVEIRDGTLDTDPVVFYLLGENINSASRVNARCGTGVRATVTTGGEYLIVYE